MRPLLFALLLFCTQAALPQATGDVPDPDWQAEIDLFNRFMASGDPAGAYAHAQKSLAIAQRKHLGPRFVAGSEWGLATALDEQGKLAEAEQLHRDALRLRESVLPPTHYRVLQSVHGLARTLYRERKYNDAEPLLLRTVAGFDAIPDRDGPQECALGAARSELGYIRTVQQRYDEGLGLLLRAIDTWELVGVGCGELHDLWWDLGLVYQFKGDVKQEEAAYRRAVREFEAGDATEDPHYPTYLAALGSFYVRQERYTEAEKPLQQALTMLEQRPQGYKTPLERTFTAYIELLQKTGRTVDARNMQARLDALHQTVVGVEAAPAAQLQAQLDLAQRAEQEQRFAAAEQAYRAAVAAAGKLPASDDRFVMAYLALVSFLENQQRPSEGLIVLSDGIKAVEGAPQPAPMAATLFVSLAERQMMGNHNAAAQATLRRGLAYSARWKRPDDALELSHLSTLARTQGRTKEAVSFAIRSLQAAEAQFGPNQFPISMYAETLGLAYEADRQYPAAEQQYLRALALAEKQFGTNHPALGGSLIHLATVYRLEGKHAEAAQVEARRQTLGR